MHRVYHPRYNATVAFASLHWQRPENDLPLPALSASKWTFCESTRLRVVLVFYLSAAALRFRNRGVTVQRSHDDAVSGDANDFDLCSVVDIAAVADNVDKVISETRFAGRSQC